MLLTGTVSSPTNAATKAYVDGLVGSASTLPFTPTGNIAATNVQAAIAEVDSEKVAKLGDTMTGGLELHPPAATWASLNLNKSAATDANVFTGKLNGLSRWWLRLGSNTAETGGNVGGEFSGRSL